MGDTSDWSWREEDYVDYLRSERLRYVWVLVHYGDRSAATAEAEALARYPYEPADAPYRGLIFHDEAWHWAMGALHGDAYPVTHPHLVTPPDEYRQLD